MKGNDAGAAAWNGTGPEPPGGTLAGGAASNLEALSERRGAMALTQLKSALLRRPAPVQIQSVPGRIRVITSITVAALILLFAALMITTVSARQGLRLIGHEAGPQVVATANLYFTLSDMDAQVAGVLLMGRDYAVQRQQALQRYEQRRTQAGRALLQSFELAGDDPLEQRTIQAVLDGLGRYDRLAGQALLLSADAKYPAGAPPQRVLRVYRAATDLMEREVLPQAYNLTLENGTIVRGAHDQERSAVLAGRGVVIVAGVIALGCLVWLQVFLARRFRRLFNPALLLVSAVTAMYTFTGVSVLGKETNALLTAKRDGFDSVLTLAKARAISNNMHADQTRHLLDPVRADTYAQVYFEKSQSLFYVAADNLGGYYDKVTAAAAAYPREKGFLGLLGDESRRPAGSAETAAMRDMAAAYARFQQADGRLRALSTEDGRAAAAVAVRLGPLSTEYERYDAGLVELTKRRLAVFERSVGNGEDALADLWFLLPAAMISITVLVIAGVRPRLNEYR